MSTPLKVEFKIGEIEFKSEGDPADVERQREAFVNTLLPLAVDAMVRTRGEISNSQQRIETNANNSPALLITENVVSNAADPFPFEDNDCVDFSRESLNTYINKFGNITDQEFVVLATYFAEFIKGGEIISITIDTVKQYYEEARKTKYSNLSQLLTGLVKKGLLKDDDKTEKKIPKSYVLTNDGLKFAEDFVPKSRTSKSKKSASKIESIYSHLNADTLNLKNYPNITSSMDFIDQMILVMHIVVVENLGNDFSTADVQYLMTSKLSLPATIDQINGVFNRKKKWFEIFKDEKNKKSVRRRLLLGAKEYAQSIISKSMA